MKQFKKLDFINTTKEMIEREGINSVSIRKIAKKMECSSAALYKHFDGLEHLVLYACVGYLEPYISESNDIIERYDHSLRTYMEILEVFIRHSFQKPLIYEHVFLGSYDTSLNEVVRDFFEISGSEVFDLTGIFQFILTSGDLISRNRKWLQLYAPSLTPEKIEIYSDILTYEYIGMMKVLIASPDDETLGDKLTTQYMNSMRLIFTEVNT